MGNSWHFKWRTQPTAQEWVTGLCSTIFESVRSIFCGTGEVRKIRSANENARDLSASGAFMDDPIAHWILHRLILPADEVASCPASCIFPLCPGFVSGLPRTPLP